MAHFKVKECETNQIFAISKRTVFWILIYNF